MTELELTTSISTAVIETALSIVKNASTKHAAETQLRNWLQEYKNLTNKGN